MNRQDYFFSTPSGWAVGWFGSNLYPFATLEEAKDFARFWGVHIPLNV
jgi:hypothetical protein